MPGIVLRALPTYVISFESPNIWRESYSYIFLILQMKKQVQSSEVTGSAVQWLSVCRSISALDYELPESRDCVLLAVKPQHPALGLVLRMGSAGGSPPPISVEQMSE